MATEVEELLGFLSSPSPQSVWYSNTFISQWLLHNNCQILSQVLLQCNNIFFIFYLSCLWLFLWLILWMSLTKFHAQYCIAAVGLCSVRKAAVDIVQGLTGSEEGLKSLSDHSDTLLASLLNLLGDKKEFVQPVLEALINLSQDTSLAGNMVDIGIIERAMEILSKVDASIVQLLSMLLVNLTQLDSGVERMLQTGNEKLQGLYIAKLVRLFSTSSSENEGVEDPYGHIGSILVNISRMETGRKLLLDPKWSLLKQMLRQIDSPSTLRRKGVSGTLRNCCFESETQLSNLLLVSQFLWPALLLPLAGKQEYSKEDTNKMPLELAHPLSHEREPENDPEIRVQVAEALYLIAVHEGGRKALWSVNGPRILEIGYQYEEDPRVMEAYEQLGSLLVQSSGVEDAK